MREPWKSIGPEAPGSVARPAAAGRPPDALADGEHAGGDTQGRDHSRRKPPARFLTIGSHFDTLRIGALLECARTGDLRGTEMMLSKTALAGAGVLACGLLASGTLAAAPAARADAIIATCTSTVTDKNVPALDQGFGDDNQQAVSFSGTGTISCPGIGSSPLTGDVSFTGQFPADQCTGVLTAGTLDTTIKWSDGKISTTQSAVTGLIAAIDGQETGVMAGTVSPDSTRFAGDEVATTVAASGSGCGSAQGDTGSSDTSTVTFLGL
jgi:hypothetical protein